MLVPYDLLKCLVCPRSRLSSGRSYQAKALAELIEILPYTHSSIIQKFVEVEKMPGQVLSITPDLNPSRRTGPSTLAATRTSHITIIVSKFPFGLDNSLLLTLFYMDTFTSLKISYPFRIFFIKDSSSCHIDIPRLGKMGSLDLSPSSTSLSN